MGILSLTKYDLSNSDKMTEAVKVNAPPKSPPLNLA